MIQKIIVVLSLIQLSAQSATYLYFDSNGISNLTKAIVGSGALSDDRQFKLNKEINIIIGTLYIQDVNLHNITLDPTKFLVDLDPQNNAINLEFSIDSFMMIVNMRLKLFGITLSDGLVNIMVKGTNLGGKLVLNRRESDGGLIFGFKDQQLTSFDAGKIHIIEVKTWWKKLITQITNPIMNLVLHILSGTIGNAIANEVQDIGTQLPASLNLGGAFEGVVVPLNLTQVPTVGDSEVRFDFVCGQAESNKAEIQNYVNFGISEQCINDLLNKIYQLRPSPINISAIAQQISEVTEINTKTLGGLFPGFQKFGIPQDVKFDVALNGYQTPSIQFDPVGIMTIQAPIMVKLVLLQTQELSTMGLNLDDKIIMLLQQKFDEVNYTDFNMTVKVDIGAVKAFGGFAVSIQQIDTNSYEQSDSALEQDLFNEANWEDIKEVGLSFAMSFANQVLYQKLLNIHGLLDLEQIEVQALDKELRLQFKFN